MSASSPRPAERLARVRRSRAARVAGRLLLTLLVLRLLLWIALPVALTLVARSLGMRCDWSDLRLSVLSGELELRRLSLRSRASLEGSPLARAERLHVDLDWAAALRGVARATNLDLDGFELWIEIDPEGASAWDAVLGRGSPRAAAAASSTPPASTSDEGAGWSFAPPLEARAQMLRARTHLRDASVDPPLQLTLEADARLELEAGRGRATLWLSAGPALESARLACEFTARAERLELDARASFARLDPAAFRGRLALLGVDVLGGSLSGGLASRLELDLLDRAAPSIAALAHVRDVRLLHDHEPAFELGALTLRVHELRRDALLIDALGLDRPSARAALLADGRLAFAGLTTRAESAGAAPPPQSASPPPASEAWRLVLERLALRGGRLELEDRSSDPPLRLEWLDARLGATDLHWPGTDALRPAHFELFARSPELCEELAVDGTVRATREGASLDARLSAGGVTLERLRARLATLGLTAELESAAAQARVKARFEARSGPDRAARFDLECEDLRWGGRSEWFGLERFELRGAELAGRDLRVERIGILAPRGELRRGADGALHALGFAWRPAPAPAPESTPLEPSPPPASAPAAAPAAAPFDSLVLGAFTLERAALALVDESADAPLRFELRDAGVELANLALGAVESPSAGAVRAWMACDGLVERASLDGQLRRGVGELGLRLSFVAAGIDARRLAPYARQLGVELTLSEGEARGELDALATLDGARWRLDATLEDLRLEERGQPLASLERAALRGLECKSLSAGVDFAALEVSAPRLRVERDEQGRFAALGARSAALDPQPQARDEASGNAGVADAQPEPDVLFPLRVRGASLALSDLRLELTDRGVAPPVEWVLHGAASTSELRLGEPGPPASVELRGGIETVLGEARAVFALEAERTRVRVVGEAELARFDPGALAAYLPSGVTAQARELSARAGFDFELARRATGGFAVRASLEAPAWRDGERNLLSAERMSVDAPAIDLARGEFELRELVVAGLATSIETGDGPGVALLGVRIGGPSSTDPAAVTAAAAAGAQNATRAPARKRSVAPRVVVGDVHVELAELAWRRAGAAPARLAASLDHFGPRVWLASELDRSQPIALELTGSLAPLCGALDARLDAAPFAPSPHVALRVDASELRGAGLTELWPELAARFDGAALEHGALTGQFEAHFDVRRRGALELDPLAPIGFDAALTGLAFRSTPEGEVLAGLDALRVEGGLYAPREGALTIASLELETPRARVARDERGLHALGCTLLSAPRQAAAPDAAPHDAPHDAPPAAREPRATQLPDLTIGRVVGSGIDVELLDTSGPTPARIALTQLDAELKRFSLPGVLRGEPLAFRATAGAGDLELPPRVVADSLLEGIGLGVAELLSTARTPSGTERRPLFSEANLSGKLAPWPEPRGWATFNVEGLELLAFRGPALAQGLQIGDGLLDADVRLRFDGRAGVSVDASSTFAHLSLAEPADGMLARYLSLPAPLDTVLFLLKDAEGRHKLSVGFRATSSGVGRGELARGAAAAAAQAIARAVAQSPLRLLSSVTDLVGLTGDAGPPPAAERFELEFAAGDATLPQGGRPRLERLASTLRSRPRRSAILLHELSSADLERSARLVHPTLDDRERLTERLRERKAQLTRERDALAARARAELALADAGRAQANSLLLRTLESQIAQADAALERLLELARPGAERRAGARARAAALALSAERLERVRRALLALGVEDTRIVVQAARAATSAPLEAGGRVVLWTR